MVTPIKKDLTPDLPALKKLTEHLVNNGADYLLVMGPTGESVTLDKEDKKAVLETVISANAGRKPIVLGVGGNNTMELCNQLSRLDSTGLTAVLSVTPYYNKPTQNGLFEHYKALSEHSKLPIILYNVPGRTSVNLLPDTVSRIAFDCRNVIGIKEASGNMEQIMTVVNNTPKEFLVISGDDALTLPLISVEGNPAGIKEVLSHLDICENYMRLPLVPVSQSTSEKLRRLMIDEELTNYL